MSKPLVLPLAATLVAALLQPALAEEKLDWAAVGRIREEGFRHSQVMETAAQLTDVHGPRLTGSPQYKEAAEWARQQLESWGLSSAHLESWPFGRGWSYESCFAQVVAPVRFPLWAIPKAWTDGTGGPVRGSVLRVKVDSEEDVQKFKGTIAGKVLWVGESRTLKGPEEGGVFKRYTEKQLEEIEQYQLPGQRGRGPMGPMDREAYLKRRRLQRALEKLYEAERPLAVVEPSERDADVLQLGSGGSRKAGDPKAVAQLVVSATQWNRVARLLERKLPVEVELDVKTTFHEADTNGYNVVAELPGTDRVHGEQVLLGAHLDSWHPGTGATDNAAGSAVMMEAIRILKAIDAKPKRTVRIGLWGGEEQGLLGSRAYVEGHLASRPQPKEEGPDELPSWMRNDPPAPVTLKPEHAKVSAYFNYDNGTGKIRGIYLQENAAARPVFEAWMEAVKDLGATRVTLRNTGGTDHQSFDSVGVPGFQFIQDPIEYMDGNFFGTHHTDMDTYDRLQREDLMQAAVVIATFAWHAAMREEMMPRKPQPPVAAPVVAPSLKLKGDAKPATTVPAAAARTDPGR
ncbi:MAG TPA: M20/M25/M40 family metallo-hydrolase [Vicinamibacteria bacterium]|nr:M20/M25/M40 family metallo-hydrolase [Vicinamibacteria bacterium]